METIAAVLQHVPDDRRTEAIARLRAITAKSVAEIRECISSGRPVLVERLFTNSHDESAHRLRSLLTEIIPLGASIRLLEFDDGSDAGSECDESREITVEILRHILDSHDEQRRHRQEMWDQHRHL